MEKISFKQELFIEGYGNIEYHFSNDFNEIMTIGYKHFGGNISNRKSEFIDNVDWYLNDNLSENVKHIMVKHNVCYSIVTLTKEQNKEFIINKRFDDKWYILMITNHAPYFEEDIHIEGYGLLRYSFTSDFDEIVKVALTKFGINRLEIDNLFYIDEHINWKPNKYLDKKVKKAMKKYGAYYSMTVLKEEEHQLVAYQGEKIISKYNVPESQNICINKLIGDKSYIFMGELNLGKKMIGDIIARN